MCVHIYKWTYIFKYFSNFAVLKLCWFHLYFVLNIYYSPAYCPFLCCAVLGRSPPLWWNTWGTQEREMPQSSRAWPLPHLSLAVTQVRRLVGSLWKSKSDGLLTARKQRGEEDQASIIPQGNSHSSPNCLPLGFGSGRFHHCRLKAGQSPRLLTHKCS